MAEAQDGLQREPSAEDLIIPPASPLRPNMFHASGQVSSSPWSSTFDSSGMGALLQSLQQQWRQDGPAVHEVGMPGLGHVRCRSALTRCHLFATCAQDRAALTVVNGNQRGSPRQEGMQGKQTGKQEQRQPARHSEVACIPQSPTAASPNRESPGTAEATTPPTIILERAAQQRHQLLFRLETSASILVSAGCNCLGYAWDDLSGCHVCYPNSDTRASWATFAGAGCSWRHGAYAAAA